MNKNKKTRLFVRILCGILAVIMTLSIVVPMAYATEIENKAPYVNGEGFEFQTADPICVDDLSGYLNKLSLQILEKQKDILLNEYNNLLKDNLLLKFENENIEIDKIKDVLEEINLLSSLRKQHKKTIVTLETQYKALTEETEQITNQIKNVVHTLEGLNIDNPKLNKEITIISQQLNPYMKRLNRSFSQGYVNEDWIDANKIYEQTVKGNKYKHRWRNVLTCIN